jgi:transcriptional regulator with XRE-family HTH domain
MYETNQRTPDPDTLKQIAKFFNVSIDYLLGYTNIRTPAEKITEVIKNNPEILKFWEEISRREDLNLMMKQAKELGEEDIKTILMLIKRFKNEQAATQI